VDEAADDAAAEIGRQIRIARRNAALSLRVAAGVVGLDYSTFGRIERHELGNVSMRQLALACTAVGLEISVRAYPGGDPARDAAQLKVLGRFRSRLPPAAPWATEVPMPIPGDLRALDGWTRLLGVTIGVEAETRPRDLQAVVRKALLKKRDAGLDRMILLLAESRANREMLALHREDLRAVFPLDTRSILAAISKGEPPAGDGIVVL
jgi:hypothetical protein